MEKMKKMTKSNFKIRKSSLYLMIFVVLVMIPTGPLVLNISMGISEKSLNSSSVIYDIQINSPEAITYNNPMSGYYPALHGFEDKTNGDTPNNWDNWERKALITTIFQKA